MLIARYDLNAVGFQLKISDREFYVGYKLVKVEQLLLFDHDKNALLDEFQCRCLVLRIKEDEASCFGRKSRN